MIHPISNAEKSLVFLQPNESGQWISVVWTSQSKPNHSGLHYILRHAEEVWHLLLTLSRGGFQGGKRVPSRPRTSTTGRKQGNSHCFPFEHGFCFKKAFDTMKRFLQRNRWKAWGIMAFGAQCLHFHSGWLEISPGCPLFCCFNSGSVDRYWYRSEGKIIQIDISTVVLSGSNKSNN